MVRPRAGGAWQFYGASGRYMISGASNDAVLIGYEKAIPKWAEGRGDFFLFDPMTIGLGGMKELGQGAGHMALLGALRRTAIQKDMWDIKDYGEKLVARSRGGVLVVVNRDQGYLPIEFTTENENGKSEQWNVEYEKIGECWLAEHAVLKVRDGNQTTEFVFDFRWKSINQRLSTGLKAAERIGEKFNINVVEF